MICPRCNNKLSYSEIEDHKIETCMSCHGIWLDKKQLNAFLMETEGDFELSSIDDNPHKDGYPIIKCRRCKNVDMKKINFLDYSDIIMDYCPQCGGFWLDKDELGNIKEYVKKIEEGSHDIRYHSTYNFLVKLSKFAYSIFH